VTNEHESDWDPRAEQVRANQEAAYDEMRKKCPVARSGFLGWSLFRHEDVLRVLLDHETFSNAVSQHLTVPNGMDPPEHTAYRRIVEPYFSPEKMRAFEPACRAVTARLLGGLGHSRQIEFVGEVALPFAVSVQCAWLGWPDSLKPVLVDWVKRNQAATLAQDRPALARIAAEFEAIIEDLLEARRQSGAGPDQDVTASLMHEQVWGRPLSNEEVASILRNWTAGEIGTISASAGILVQFLAANAELQATLRAGPGLLPEAIDEILRIHGPLVTNRRLARKDAQIGGKTIPAGERLTLNWVSANRDEAVFEAADEFRFGRDPSKNLLYGAGIHVCPGAPLARLELRVFMEEWFRSFEGFELDPERPPGLAMFPSSGFSTLCLRVW
jgi:cytochrome P450